MTPPIRPGPAVAATASSASGAMLASASAVSMTVSMASTWARAAISGTTPPNGACSSSWLSTMLDRMSPGPGRHSVQQGGARCGAVMAFTVLGIETSCDETAAAVVRGWPPGPGDILSNIVLSQLEEHAPFGGVVPEIAARAHVEAIDTVIETALAEASIAPDALDAVAATAGPGLIGGVMVGLTTAKALALAWDKPLVAVNHLEAHALTARLTDGV